MAAVLATTDDASRKDHAQTRASPASVIVTFERGDEVELAERVIEYLGPHTIFDEGNFKQYHEESGIWQTLRSDHLEALVSRYAGSPVLSPRAHILSMTHNKIAGAIKIARARLGASNSRLNFAGAAPGVAFRNGFVGIMDGNIYLDQHCHGQMAQHAFPLSYVPDAPHPMLDEFFAQVFEDAEPGDRMDQTLLCQEFLGTCLIGDATRHQRCLVLLGSGANGKSTFLEIAEAVFPPHSITSVPPQDWGKQFRTASLVGALVNLVNEIPEHDIVANAIFKSIISGEPVQGERKFQSPFSFRPRAGHIFAANSLPATNDQSHGFWRRFLVVPFTRDMERSEVHRKGIATEILRAELSAILGWAFEGAARVQRNGRYTVPASSTRLVADWRRESDSVRLFLETECSADSTTGTLASELYRHYRIWSEACGLRPVSIIGFGRRAKLSGFRSRHDRSGNFYNVRPTSKRFGER